MFFSARRLKYIHLAYFSQPKHDRLIYRVARRCRVRSIVEMGIGDGHRAERLLRLARSWADNKPVRYTAIDEFELRSKQAGPGVSLKAAYRKLKATGAKIQVVPGDPLAALARVANALTSTDLLLISADQDDESLEAAWFYVPRMLHARSQVLFEEIDNAGSRWRMLSHEQVARLAQRRQRHLRRAA
jgi:hypothetical protein